MQTLVEMPSFISIIVNEQMNVISVPRQIVEGLEDELERTLCHEKFSLLVYTCLEIEISLVKFNPGRNEMIGSDEQSSEADGTNSGCNSGIF